jgi:streptogramin lyase
MKHIVYLAAFILAGSAAAQTTVPYKVQNRFPIAGTDGWNCITVDSDARRIYVSHGVRVNVLNADFGAQVGTIEDTPGVHGVAIATSSKHGPTSNGKKNKVSIFNVADLSVIKKIEVGKGPDGIYYDAKSDHIFTNNHGSHDITAIDATTGEVVGTVAAGGDGEGMVTDKDGLIYVALEDKNEICAFDPKTLDVKRHMPLQGIEAPTRSCVDRKYNRLFVGGHKKMALVLNAVTGNKIASFPTGSGRDAVGWDGKNQLAFISNGEGNITVIREKSADESVVEAPIVTQPSTKTMAFDKKTGKIFLPAATVVVTPPADPTQKPKRAITEGTFAVLVVGK